jgi:hypothetical protein
MTLVCALPTTLIVQQGVPDAKRVAHCSTTLSLTRKVRFNELVRLRRTASLPRSTQEEFQTIWFTQKEIVERMRKDKRLRHAIARQPEVFDTEKLLSLGLYTEMERLQRCKRAIAARGSILSKTNSMDVDSSSDSGDSSGCLTTTNYVLHSEAAAIEAHERALQHSNHVQTMVYDDDASGGDTSLELSVTDETAPQALRSMELSNSNPPHRKLGRRLIYPNAHVAQFCSSN